MCKLCYIKVVQLGLILAFDEGILTGYLQVDCTRYVHNVIATFTAKAKSFVAVIASAFQPQVLATARV